MEPLTLAFSDGDAIKVLAVGGGLLIGLVAIVGGLIQTVLTTRAREATKREIAAYIAEGTMTAEDAERVLTSDIPHWKKNRPC